MTATTKDKIQKYRVVNSTLLEENANRSSAWQSVAKNWLFKTTVTNLGKDSYCVWRKLTSEQLTKSKTVCTRTQLLYRQLLTACNTNNNKVKNSLITYGC